jgi:hypothetical protein
MGPFGMTGDLAADTVRVLADVVDNMDRFDTGTTQLSRAERRLLNQVRYVLAQHNAQEAVAS